MEKQMKNSKEISQLKEIVKLGWDDMDNEQRELMTSVFNLQKECRVLLEDQFVQQFHDIGDELYDLVERCKGKPYAGVSGGEEVARLIIQICKVYLNEKTTE
jgi:hypothetical protein